MKDLIGLIKYLLIMLLVVLLPIALYWLFALSFGPDEIFPQIGKKDFGTIANIILGGLILFIWYMLSMLIIVYYFKLPIVYTKKIIDEHWSKYLDFFFNSFFLTTLILILICMGIIIPIEKTIDILNFKIDTYYIVVPLLFILPVYFIIYITTIFTNSTKEITNAPKLIIWLNKIPKWVYFMLIAFICLLNRENGHIYAIITLGCISILLNIRIKPQSN